MKRTTMLMVAAILVASLISFGCSKSHEMAPGSLGDFGDIGSPPWQAGTDLTADSEIVPSMVDKVEIVLLGGDVIAADMSRPFPRAIKAIRVTFTDGMDQSDVQDMFSLLRDGAQVSGSFDWPDDRTMEFKPEKKSAYKAENMIALNGDEIAKYRTMALNDVNGDGFADIFIGAPNMNMPPSGDGYVYFIPGRDTFPGSSAVGAVSTLKLEAENITDRLGYGAVVAGDLNADGYADLAVGAYRYDGAKGRLYVIYGKDGLSITKAADADVKVTGKVQGDGVGLIISALGDVDGDGYDDLASADFKGAGGYGKVNILSGKTIVPSLTSIEHGPSFIGENQGVRFGIAVTSADVDGDGMKDILVGSSTANTSGGQTGKVFIFRGAATITGVDLSDPSQKADFTIDGEDVGSEFGTAISSLGFYDSDTSEDVVVGAWKQNTSAGVSGRVYLFSGAKIVDAVNLVPTNDNYLMDGDAADDALGSFLASVVSFSGDKRPAVIAAAPLYDGGMGLIKMKMMDVSPAAELKWPPASDPSTFGAGVEPLGDVNGDTFADFIVSVPRTSVGIKSKVVIILGNENNVPSFSDAVTLESNADTERLGAILGSQLSH